MKKLLAALLAALLVLGAGAALAEEGAEEAQVFIMGFDPNYAPYTYMGDDGNYTGFDIEMCKALCELLGWEYQEFPVNWDTKDQELYSGACSCIWSGFTINGREDEYAWSYPYVDNTQVILTRADAGIAALADLSGRVVGVQVATSALELLEGDEAELAATFGSLIQFDSYLTAFTELQAGAIDAIAIDVGVAQYYVAEYGESYVILEESIAAEQYGIGFRLEDTELRDAVNAGLMELVANGTYQALAEKYGLTDFICLTADDTAE